MFPGAVIVGGLVEDGRVAAVVAVEDLVDLAAVAAAVVVQVGVGRLAKKKVFK